MIERSENILSLAVALSKAQKKMGAALKNAENPYYKSKYSDFKAVIDTIKEPLNENGISFLQAVEGSPENPTVETILLHESGQYFCIKTPIYCLKPNDPQAFGKGITYSKRYALQALLGLPSEDDDAEAAMNRDGKTKPATKSAPQAQKKSNAIVEQAFFNYTTEKKDECLEHFEYSKEKFTEAIIKHFKALPTRKDSIKKIIETIKPEEVMVEIQSKGAEE